MQTDLQFKKVRTARQIDDPGAALRQRRKWFADDPEAKPDAETDEQGQEGDGEGTSDGTKKTVPPTTVPYDEFKKINSARRAAEAKIAQFEKEREDARLAGEKQQTEEAAKRGEFEKLYTAETEKVKSLTTQVGELERYKVLFEEQVKGMREGLPDFVVELLDKMNPLEQAEYLSKNGEKLRKPKAPGLDGGRGNGGGNPKPSKTNPIGSW